MPDSNKPCFNCFHIISKIDFVFLLSDVEETRAGFNPPRRRLVDVPMAEWWYTGHCLAFDETLNTVFLKSLRHSTSSRNRKRVRK